MSPREFWTRCETTLDPTERILEWMKRRYIRKSERNSSDFLADMLARQDNLSVLNIKDYIGHPKESGYKSYHMLLSIQVALADAVIPTKVEVQIRTMAMDFWASLEHKIYYKYEGNAPGYFARELQECASIISRLDAKMMSLNEAMRRIDGE